MAKHKQVRIKDIAQAAGVSTGTVDRVLHGRGNVAPEKEQKVLRVMEELGYQRNLLASTLAYNKSFRIAVLIPDFEIDPYWAQVYKGVQLAYESVRHFGIELEIHLFDSTVSAALLEKGKFILETPPDGLLFPPIFTEESQQLFALCEQKEIPLVIINTLLENPHSLSYIGQHSYESGFLAARLFDFALQAQQSLLILHMEENEYISQHLIDKVAGFHAYFNSVRSQPIRIETRTFETYQEAAGLKSFLQDIFREMPHLGGIFFTNSRAYLALNSWPEPELYHKILIGFDLVEENIRFLKEDKINFLINQNPFQQGFLGLTTLFKYLVRKEQAIPHQFLPLDIVVKENVHYYQDIQLKINALL